MSNLFGGGDLAPVQLILQGFVLWWALWAFLLPVRLTMGFLRSAFTLPRVGQAA